MPIFDPSCPAATAAAGPSHCSVWIWNVLGDCVCSPRDLLSLLFGLASIAAWAASEVPQIVSNFSEGPSEEVSLAFVLTWIVGDVFNLVGCLLSPVAIPTQLITAVLYATSTLLLVAQHVSSSLSRSPRPASPPPPALPAAQPAPRHVISQPSSTPVSSAMPAAIRRTPSRGWMGVGSFSSRHQRSSVFDALADHEDAPLPSPSPLAGSFLGSSDVGASSAADQGGVPGEESSSEGYFRRGRHVRQAVSRSIPVGTLHGHSQSRRRGGAAVVTWQQHKETDYAAPLGVLPPHPDAQQQQQQQPFYSGANNGSSGSLLSPASSRRPSLLSLSMAGSLSSSWRRGITISQSYGGNSSGPPSSSPTTRFLTGGLTILTLVSVASVHWHPLAVHSRAPAADASQGRDVGTLPRPKLADAQPLRRRLLSPVPAQPPGNAAGPLAAHAASSRVRQHEWTQQPASSHTSSGRLSSRSTSAHTVHTVHTVFPAAAVRRARASLADGGGGGMGDDDDDDAERREQLRRAISLILGWAMACIYFTGRVPPLVLLLLAAAGSDDTAHAAEGSSRQGDADWQEEEGQEEGAARSLPQPNGSAQADGVFHRGLVENRHASPPGGAGVPLTALLEAPIPFRPFLLGIAGNAAYLLSVLVRSLSLAAVVGNLPWLLDAAACMAMDIAVLSLLLQQHWRFLRQRHAALIASNGYAHEEEEADGLLYHA